MDRPPAAVDTADRPAAVATVDRPAAASRLVAVDMADLPAAVSRLVAVDMVDLPAADRPVVVDMVDLRAADLPPVDTADLLPVVHLRATADRRVMADLRARRPACTSLRASADRWAPAATCRR